MTSYGDSYRSFRFGPPRSSLGRALAKDSPLRRLDWIMILAALALSLIGSLLVWSATRGRDSLTHGDPQYFLYRHLTNLLIGVGLCAAVVLLGTRRLRTAVPFIYLAVILLLFAVLSPLGSTINGAHSWIQFGGGFSIQPAEFAKLAIVLGMAVVLSARVDAGEREFPPTRSVLQSLGVAAFPMAVVMLMPDLGSVMVMVVTVLGVLMASGAANRWVIGLLAGGTVGALAIWKLGVLSQYQIDRFAAFANPALDPSGVGYNTAQARIAIGSGGLTGMGLFHGTQTTGQFVPEQQTDFVFSVAGEELGFAGGLVMIGLLGVILWRACRIARQATDLYGTILAAGAVTWFAFQAFENIGMNLGIMPVAGIPLPFVSYGGSSMFAVWIAVGLLQSVRSQRPIGV
ncbi:MULTISPECIES: rod shape-determining protein RodA [Kitasatospora]|uniref:peptidoglycan glycosyltransferase n=1 Tax=Kitasatospora setae (strain ATCC 33774 / DSM 43861 / JCM 3304 / KCC A-0304 / NBRC 14216 / KM-6054) TaxID=452652 RepID=E4NB43_KITSK|nr:MULTISPECIES: rod shape-determining protein RodA [Kitasatospora]BAJ28424.1 putative rod shape-determining protein [Kitasatospora setae KM-6054]